MIKLAIIEPKRVHQQYLIKAINKTLTITCVGIFEDGHAAIEGASKVRPDIIITDIELPGISGIDSVKLLMPVIPQTKFMVWSQSENLQDIVRALMAGAKSYITKCSKPYQIIDAIEEVSRGYMPLSSKISTKILGLVQNKLSKTSCEVNRLEHYEEIILELLAQGHSYKYIADTLEVKIASLKWTIYQMYKKLKVVNRFDAIKKIR